MPKMTILDALRRAAFAALVAGGIGGTSGLWAADACAPSCAAAPGCASVCAPGPDCLNCDRVFGENAQQLSQDYARLMNQCCNPPCATECAPAPTGCGTIGGCGSGCPDGCGLGWGCLGGELGDPWTLIGQCDDGCGNNWLKDNGYVLGGYMQWGYQSGPDGAFTGNGPFLNQKEWDSFNLNQGYLFFGKVADGSKGFDWGFRGDIFYGVDGNEGQSFGNVDPGRFDYLNGWDHGIYEWALPQIYGEVAMGDLSVKAGHFYTIVGYEVIPSTGQFFLSRQLTFWNSEPFTHTGALASYKVNDKLSVSAGWTLGMDTGFDQFGGGNAFLGGLTYNIDDKTQFIYGMTGGNLGWRGQGAINSFILTRQWTEKWSTVHQFDVLQSNLKVDAAGVPLAGNIPTDFKTSGIAGDSTGLINYAFYDITPRLKAGTRFEWYKADGTSYYTWTYGVNIKPTANLVVRPEVRHMWAPGNSNVGGLSSGTTKFDGEIFNQTVFGIDAILTF